MTSTVISFAQQLNQIEDTTEFNSILESQILKSHNNEDKNEINEWFWYIDWWRMTDYTMLHFIQIDTEFPERICFVMEVRNLSKWTQLSHLEISQITMDIEQISLKHIDIKEWNEYLLWSKMRHQNRLDIMKPVFDELEFSPPTHILHTGGVKYQEAKAEFESIKHT